MKDIATVPPPNQGARMNALIPTSIADAIRLADIMSNASLIPGHLQNKPGDCLLIVMQAQRWGMDAVSVAQCTSVVKGKLCYEGKLVAAALYAMGAIDGRLRYEFSGSGDSRRVIVTGKPRGTGADQTVEGTVGDWKTDNGNWKKSPDDMLVYRGTRQWARRYAPEALLGVYTPDELEDGDAKPVATVVPAEVVYYSEASFAENLPKWRDLIEAGRPPERIIAMVESKAPMTEAQKSAVLAIKPKPQPEPEGDAAVTDAEFTTEGEQA